VNGILNSVVDERYKDALEEAKEADRMIQSGEWSKDRLEKERPFHGVPISTKESTCVKGNCNYCYCRNFVYLPNTKQSNHFLIVVWL